MGTRGQAVSPCEESQGANIPYIIPLDLVFCMKALCEQ